MVMYKIDRRGRGVRGGVQKSFSRTDPGFTPLRIEKHDFHKVIRVLSVNSENTHVISRISVFKSLNRTDDIDYNKMYFSHKRILHNHLYIYCTQASDISRKVGNHLAVDSSF